ncbi:MAG TPA: PAS domain S-box protein [Bacteroidota bacterium]|jgi:PAS domain S-box-containing protein|nr:PAS domain S-box protein [Bacteroidota bacterium]
MNTYPAKISESYKISLQNYLNGEGESALRVAYELGRRSITEEMSSVNLVATHQEALLHILKETPASENSSRLIQASWQFLLESLSPFEMTIRGYRETLNTLQISEERYRRLIDTARDVIFSLSPQGNIRSLNPVFEDLTGFARSQWLGKSFESRIHPDDLNFSRLIFQRILRGETPPAFELRIEAKSGEYLTGEFTTAPQFEEGEVIGAFGIARDVTERRHAQEQMRSLAKRVVNAQEEERRRLARELHDDLCQWLSGMKLSLNLLEENLPGPRTLRKTLRALKEEVNGKIGDIRRLAVSLRPSALDDFGLVVALSRLSEDCERLHKIAITFQANGPVLEHYHHEVETALYRITQEGLSNMGKHSRASRGKVSISHVGTSVTLDIEDDGIGFDKTKLEQQRIPGQGLGFVSMNERTMLLGGAFRVDSRQNGGTKIHVAIPMESYSQ